MAGIHTVGPTVEGDLAVTVHRTSDRSTALITDRELVDRIRGGNPEALALLYDCRAGELFALARRITGSDADAEDVVHDLFLGLPELLHRYMERGQLRAWLRQVTARLALLRLRRANRRDEMEQQSASADNAWSAAGDASVDLATAIDALPGALRTVFVLKQVEGFTHEEIATLLGISAGASRVRFVRAVRRLRTLLEPGS